jgi:hypothetical protein
MRAHRFTLRTPGLLGTVTALLALAVEPGAAPTTGECDGPFEHFDSWMGEWDVTNEHGS